MHPKWVSLHPAVLSMVACMCAVVEQNNGRFSAELSDIVALRYLQRMHLFRYLKVGFSSDFEEHEEAGRFIPIHRVSTRTEIQSFVTDMVPLLHAPPAEVDQIRYVVSEILNNAVEHSRSPVGAYVCAQYYRKKNTVSIGVADAGVGIRQSLARSHGVRNDWDALALAMIPGVSGAGLGGYTSDNAGVGLFFTRAIAKASRRYFVLYSGSAAYKLRAAKPEGGRPWSLHVDAQEDPHSRLQELPSWPGTLVGIDISTEPVVAFSRLVSVLRQIYTPEQTLEASGKILRRLPRFT